MPEEFIVTSTTSEKPKLLSEIAVVTENQILALDKLVGKDFAVELLDTNIPIDHFQHVFQKIVIRNFDDLLIILHEAGHGIADEKDKLAKKIKGKIEARVRTGGQIQFSIEEVADILRVRSERIASAFALRKLRELKEKVGIDLLADGAKYKILARIHLGIESAFGSLSTIKEYKNRLKRLEDDLQLKK